MKNDGDYFLGEAPNIIKEYAKELQEYIVGPLVKEGYTKLEAIMIHMAFQQRHLRDDVRDLVDSEKDDWEG